MAIDYKAIADYTALQSQFAHMWLLAKSTRYVRLYNPKSHTLVNHAEVFRRGNDWRAAAYAHSVAMDQGSGDDCIDAQGNVLELKLAIVDSDLIHLGVQRKALLHGVGDTSIGQAYRAKFRVYKGTKAGHHKKDTAFILMSKQHNCFITGFMMTGEKVNSILTETDQKGESRIVTLANFMRDGHEFKSRVPHIGWDRYNEALTNMVKAREREITGDEALAAKDEWVKLANPNNLNRL